MPKRKSATDETLHHSNDKSFKKVFQVKETVLEYIHKFFPLLEKHLDLTQLELDNTNYINKEFEEHFSDVVYRTQLKRTSDQQKPRTVAVVLLFEHKKVVSSYFHLFLQLL